MEEKYLNSQNKILVCSWTLNCDITHMACIFSIGQDRLPGRGQSITAQPKNYNIGRETGSKSEKRTWISWFWCCTIRASLSTFQSSVSSAMGANPGCAEKCDFSQQEIMMKRILLCVLALLQLLAHTGGKITMSDPDEQKLQGGKRLCTYENSIYLFTLVTRSQSCPYSRTFSTSDNEK